MSQKPPPPAEINASADARKLGLLAATAIVVANMIGTGVFTSTGFMVPNLESGPILINWLLGGVLALCGAATYAELGTLMPRVGGEYVYLREAYHPSVGFLSGWVSLFAGFSAPIAGAGLAFGAYLHAIAPALPAKGAALALIIALTALHMADVVWGSRIQTGFTLLKVALILVFIGLGFGVGEGDWSNLDSAVPDASSSVLAPAFWISLVYVSFSYSGWNAAAYVAGEIRDPQRVLPRALLLGTAIVTALYLALNLLFLYAAPAEALAGKAEVGHVAAVALFGERAGGWLSTIIALALVSAVSAMVMAGPRVYTAMAEDGLFFSFLAARNRRGAPLGSVALQGALACILVMIASLRELIQYIGFTLSIIAALTVLSVFVLRVRRPELARAAAAAVAEAGSGKRPYRTWGWPVTPLLFVLLSLWMAAHLVINQPGPTLIAGGVTLGSGLLAYLLWSAYRRSQTR
ncbi:APC family permease [Haliangium ochraceum]|uniref:Amino acid permease-associated region n=1 Tax=Haliangium ochraceum (strain DSM 14365 / JCM 11303 / SMP-2) TaxID=502025 RepID=D0LYZ4_HALO1|nr:amino acid permease [Haliangium ochraceum]ACY14464.1 amino acid permease-associated region [Haliangium ochraceum DSM 14365]